MDAPPNEVTIADIRKNAKESYRVRLGEYKGFRFADVRIWFGELDALKPSGKGVAIRPDALPEVIKALQEAQRRLACGPANSESSQ